MNGPERLSDKSWTEVSYDDFACKPEVRILKRHLLADEGWNVTIDCQVSGIPLPAVKWVLDGRIIANLSAPRHSNGIDQKYVIREVASRKDGIGRNVSLTISSVNSEDLGSYSCVAINRGGMAELNASLSLRDYLIHSDLANEVLTILGVTGGSMVLVTAFIILRICVYRKSTAPAPLTLYSSTNPAYKDTARESLLQNSGPACRLHSRPDHAGHDRTLPSSPHIQSGIIKRPVYSSHPDQYPDLLNICSPQTAQNNLPCPPYPQPLDPVCLLPPVQTFTNTSQTNYHQSQQEQQPVIWEHNITKQKCSDRFPIMCPNEDFSSHSSEFIPLPPSPFNALKLATIHETEIYPQRRNQSKKCPPPTLPKPARTSFKPQTGIL